MGGRPCTCHSPPPRPRARRHVAPADAMRYGKLDSGVARELPTPYSALSPSPVASIFTPRWLARAARGMPAERWALRRDGEGQRGLGREACTG